MKNAMQGLIYAYLLMSGWIDFCLGVVIGTAFVKIGVLWGIGASIGFPALVIFALGAKMLLYYIIVRLLGIRLTVVFFSIGGVIFLVLHRYFFFPLQPHMQHGIFWIFLVYILPVNMAAVALACMLLRMHVVKGIHSQGPQT